MVAHYIHAFLIMSFQINLNGCPLRIILPFTPLTRYVFSLVVLLNQTLNIIKANSYC